MTRIPLLLTRVLLAALVLGSGTDVLVLHPDTVYVNGSVVTMDSANRIADNPLSVDSRRIREIPVLETIVGGKTAYRNGSADRPSRIGHWWTAEPVVDRWREARAYNGGARRAPRRPDIGPPDLPPWNTGFHNVPFEHRIASRFRSAPGSAMDPGPGGPGRRVRRHTVRTGHAGLR